MQFESDLKVTMFVHEGGQEAVPLFYNEKLFYI